MHKIGSTGQDQEQRHNSAPTHGVLKIGLENDPIDRSQKHAKQELTASWRSQPAPEKRRDCGKSRATLA